MEAAVMKSFFNGTLVLHTPTEETFNELIQIIKQKTNLDTVHINWFVYKKETCLRISNVNNASVVYDSFDYFTHLGMSIIEYTLNRNSIFSKSDFVTGMLVTLDATNKIYMVLLNTKHGDLLVDDDGYFIKLSAFDDNLTCSKYAIFVSSERTQIMRIYQPITSGSYFHKTFAKTVLWERPDLEIKVTKEEAIEKLKSLSEFSGKDLKIID